MEKVKVIIPSNVLHNSQIVTGFLMLREHGWDVEILDHTKDTASPFHDLPVVLAEYRGKKIVYDVWDGYQAPDAMEACLKYADYYFRRSFSLEKNQALFPSDWQKMSPLGFNYHVTCKHNPITEPLWKSLAKPLLGKTPDRYFVPEVFEGNASKQDGAVKILFLARLWDDKEPGFSPEELAERTYINQMRIEIIRALREKYGDSFVGGLNDNELSRAWAPDLIVPKAFTERKKYLKLLHSCDICIGSMGLFESIGWKTGEYVAAAKAIVNERFHYAVPGDFLEGKNYLPFDSAAECIGAVDRLVHDPEMLYEMKRANQEYYQNYLRPDVLVKNTLERIKREDTHVTEKNI